MNIGDTAKLTNPQDSGFGRTESAPAGRGPGTARVNTNPEDSPETILRLFVYGTLKRATGTINASAPRPAASNRPWSGAGSTTSTPVSRPLRCRKA